MQTTAIRIVTNTSEGDWDSTLNDRAMNTYLKNGVPQQPALRVSSFLFFFRKLRRTWVPHELALRLRFKFQRRITFS